MLGLVMGCAVGLGLFATSLSTSSLPPSLRERHTAGANGLHNLRTWYEEERPLSFPILAGETEKKRRHSSSQREFL